MHCALQLQRGLLMLLLLLLLVILPMLLKYMYLFGNFIR